MSVDLTGRAAGYRDIAIRCPGCGEPMRQLSLPKADAEVDVCDACEGTWVDWFDGEVRAVTTETLQVRASDPGPPPGAPGERPSRNENVAVGACPRCTKQLVPERYTVKAEVPSDRVEGRTSVVTGSTGAELLRCEDCMGAFVARASAETLSWISATDQPPRSVAGSAEGQALRPLPWERLLDLLKSLFARTPG